MFQVVAALGPTIVSLPGPPVKAVVPTVIVGLLSVNVAPPFASPFCPKRRARLPPGALNVPARFTSLAAFSVSSVIPQAMETSLFTTMSPSQVPPPVSVATTAKLLSPSCVWM